jgi:F-type H+-transporting ATPase subunit delta
MNDSQISVRYARALFSLASEKQELDEVYRDMELLMETSKLEEFQFLLMVPSLKPGRKIEILDSVFKSSVREMTSSMIGLVVKNKRELYLPGIARNFKDMYRRAMGIRSASLVTAHPVDEKTMEGVRALIARAYDADVELATAVDQDVIGGFVLRIEDSQYDASVANSLKNIRKQLLQTPSPITKA